MWILNWELGDILVILYSMGMGCSSHLFHEQHNHETSYDN
jgi:hypothetical protein